MLRTIHLHGALKRRFKCASVKLDCNSVAEAVRGLTVQMPGFAEYIRDRNYHITAANDQDEIAIDNEALLLGLGRRRHIHITPAAQAAGIETILIAGLVLTAAVSIASLFLLRPKAPDPNARERKDQSFLFNGPVNSTEQGHPVPIIYGGPIRVGSIVVSAGISTTDIAKSAIQAGSGGSYVGSTPGVLGGEGGSGGRAWQVEAQIQANKGGKSGGGSSRVAEESPNTLRSQATVKIVDLVGEGEIGGLVDGLKSVYLDDTPVQNPDGSYNFSGYSLEERLGLPDQDPMPGFTQQETGEAVGVDVTNLNPIVRTIADPVVDVARVTLSVNSLFEQDTKNGDLKPSSVQIAIDHQSNGGGYTQVVVDTIQGKTNSPYQRSYDIRLEGEAPHNIRVRRITPDSELASIKNETRWDSLFEIVEAKLTYPDSALYGITVDAKQFGSSIPGRSYEVYGLVIDVPTNYDPVARTYTGVWDGTFKRAVCNNPAWVLYDIIRNNRYGLGARIPVSSIDKFGLYAVAQYCDGLVPDGKGGQQPRYTINACIDTMESAYNVLASIASAFRGFVYWGSGSVVVAQDRPEDPTMLVSPANVVDGKLSYQSVIEKQRLRSVAIVYWNDPEDNYRLTPEIVEDDELIRRFGWKPGDSVVRFGCTNRAEAHFAARWMLDDQRNANKAVRYDAADDHNFVVPGSVVSVADPKFTVGRRGGRVRVAAASQVQLDAPVEIGAGQAYTLRVVLPDGTVSQRPVTTGASTTDTLDLGGAAWAEPPQAGAVWAIESDTVANRQFRVRSATADEPPHSIYAVVYDPNSHDRVELDLNLQPPNFLDLPTGPLPVPNNLATTEFLLQDGTSAVPSVQFSWQSANDPRILFYQARYKRPTGDWEALEDGSALARVIRNTEPGTWGFMVRAVDGLGRKTAWGMGEVVLDGQVDNLPEVVMPGLVTNPDAFTAKLAWAEPDDTRPLRYEVLYNSANDLAQAGSLGTTDRLEFPITEAGYYWVRTRFINVASPNPVVIQVTAAAIDFGGALATSISNLEDAVDGKITTFYQDGVPVAEGVGDLWFKTNTGKWYRALATGADEIKAGEWVLTEDAGVGTAIAAAAGAQATADGKITTFYQDADPAGPALPGDLWVRPSDNPKVTYRRNSVDTGWDVVANLATQGTHVGVENGADVTGAHTSAGFAGQNWGATASEAQASNTQWPGGATPKFVQMPVGGAYSQDTYSVVGKIKIGLPYAFSAQQGSDSMIRFKVDLYNYTTGRSVTYIISGYAYRSSGIGHWLNVSAHCIGDDSMARLVDFGSDSQSRFAVSIGSLGQELQYPQIRVYDVMIGYGGQSLDWGADWRVVIENSNLNYIYTGGIKPKAGDAVFGENMLEVSGGATATLPGFKTSQGTAAGYLGQTAWGTYTGATTRIQYMDDSGRLDRLDRVLDRKMTYLYRADGSTALTEAAAITSLGISSGFAGQGYFATQDYIADGRFTGPLAQRLSPHPLNSGFLPSTYIAYENGANMEPLKPGEGGANKTETRVSAGFSGQGYFATVNYLDYQAGRISNLPRAIQPSAFFPSGYMYAGEIYHDAGDKNLNTFFPEDVNSNRTENRVAAAFSGQQWGATATQAEAGNSQWAGYGTPKFVLMPQGGAYSNDTSGVTGKIKIGLPYAFTAGGTGASDAMIRFKVDVYNYTTGLSITYIISGYAYRSGGLGYWLNVSVHCVGSDTMARLVDFGYDDQNRFAISIGSIGDQWHYPQVRVHDVMIGYGGQAMDWNTDWLVTIQNSGLSFVYTGGYKPKPGDAVFGESLLEFSGGGVATLPNFKTSQGTAAAYAGQTAWGTFGASTNRVGKINDNGRVIDPTMYNTQLIVGARSTTDLVPSYSNNNGSTVTVTLPAHVRKVAGPSGPLTLTYGQASGSVAVSTYWVAHVDDPNLTGFASPSVGFSSNPDDLLYPGRYHIASGVTPSAAGDGGGTGTGSGSGGNWDPNECVAHDAWVEVAEAAGRNCKVAAGRVFIPAAEVVPHDLVRVLDHGTGRQSTRWEEVTANWLAWANGYRISSADGRSVECSSTTPLTLEDGRNVYPAEADGLALPLDDGAGGVEWVPCAVEPIGDLLVAHICCSQQTYLAGTTPGRGVYTHNPTAPTFKP